MSRLSDAEIESFGMTRKLFEMNFDFPKHMEADINHLLKCYDALLAEVTALKGLVARRDKQYNKAVADIVKLKAELTAECKACGVTVDRLISQDGCTACEMIALRKDAERYRHLKNKRAFRTTDAGGGEHRAGHYWEALVVREPVGQSFDDAVDDSIRDMK